MPAPKQSVNGFGKGDKVIWTQRTEYGVGKVAGVANEAATWVDVEFDNGEKWTLTDEEIVKEPEA